jgi:hypothetical protein
VPRRDLRHLVWVVVVNGVTLTAVGVAVVAGAPVAAADPPPLPPTQPIVPGSQGALYGPQQFPPPWYPMPNAPAETDARGVGVGTHDVLGATLEQMPNARPGTNLRLAVGVGLAPGISAGALSDLDPGAMRTPAPPVIAPIPVPSVGVGGNAPLGMQPSPSNPMGVTGETN